METYLEEEYMWMRQSSIDINQLLKEINEIEKKKAQAELRLAQIKEEEDALAKSLEEVGVKEEDLESEINKLQIEIEEEMTILRNMLNGVQ